MRRDHAPLSAALHPHHSCRKWTGKFIPIRRARPGNYSVNIAVLPCTRTVVWFGSSVAASKRTPVPAWFLYSARNSARLLISPPDEMSAKSSANKTCIAETSRATIASAKLAASCLIASSAECSSTDRASLASAIAGEAKPVKLQNATQANDVGSRLTHTLGAHVGRGVNAVYH